MTLVAVSLLLMLEERMAGRQPLLSCSDIATSLKTLLPHRDPEPRGGHPPDGKPASKAHLAGTKETYRMQWLLLPGVIGAVNVTK